MAVSQMPSLVSIPHPLVADDRAMCFAEFLPSETLRAYIERTGVVVARGPVAVWHNGHRVPDALWERLIPRRGDQIVIRARAEGNGGGNKVLRTVALVVVAIAAAYTGGAAAAAYGGTGTFAGAAAGAAASAAVTIAGTLIVNALIPLPKPNVATTSTGGTDNSPAYQIQAARNTSRPWEPMLLVMGGPIKVVPDLGSNPSTRYVGDDQYLSQIFHFGLQPDMAITDVKIGDTPLYNFQGVQDQRSGWDGAISLAYDNVDTLQGFDLNHVDGWNSRTTPVNTNYIEVEVATQLFSLDQLTGKFLPREVIFQIEYRAVGASTWIPVGSYTNPVYATHYWAYGVYATPNGGDDIVSSQDWQQISYGSLNPADHVNGEQHVVCETWGGGDYGVNTSCATYEWRWEPHPFQRGLPWQGVAPDPIISYTTAEGVRLINDSNKVLRDTYGIGVATGQYEIRVQKVSEDIATNTDSNVISVTQIRAYQNTPTDYTNQARYAVRIRATSQLNGPIDELSAMCTAFCNRWNGSAWVYGATRNPAWWFLWFALGKRDAAGNKLYGACIPETQIDVEGIKAWGAYCDAHGWKFDYVLAQKMSAHDVLTMIARAGQASYTWQSGKLGVVWDAANLPVVAMIGPYNIKAGTFEVSYVDATVDEIVGNFVNKARDWQADQVRVRVPGAPLLNNPQTFDLEGIVDASVAGRVVNLLAASQNFHRRRVSWEMDIEGYIATRGDVVQVSHDLTVWGYAGRLLAGDRNGLTLDRQVPVSGPAWLSLRTPYGDMLNIQVGGHVELTDFVYFLTPLPQSYIDLLEGGELPFVDWAWQLDPIQTPGRRLKIVSVTPTNDDGVRFEAVDDNPDYYNSETNPFAYTPPRDGALLRGVVLGLLYQEQIINVQGDVIEARLDWVLSAAMRVRIDYSINGKAFPSVTTQDRYLTIQTHTGDVLRATVTPIAATGLGVPKSGSWVVTGLLVPLPAVTGLTSVFRDGLTVLKWSAVTDIRQPVYEARIGTSWQDSKTVAITPTLETLAVGDGLYFVAARFVTPAGVVVYGPADSLLISGATLVRNVLVTVDEAPGWTGTLSDDAFVFDDQLTLVATGDILDAPDVLAVNDVLWYGGVADRGIYTTAESNIVDIGYPAPVRVDFTIDAYALNFEENILGVADVLAMTDVLNSSNQQHYRIQPQIRSANVEGEWPEWADYVPGLINARYFDVRILMETDNPLIVPFVTSFTWTIDVPDLLQQAEEVTVPSEGLHIDFPKPFHAKPNIQVTQLDAVNGDRFTLTNVTLTGFDIYFFNNTTPKAAVMNYIAQRY